QWIPAAQGLRAPRVRMIGDAITTSNHGRIPQFVSEADAWREEFLAETHSVVSGDADSSANEYLVCRGVVRLNSHAGGACPVRVEFPSHAKIVGFLVSRRPP